jgi:hypothetical protein
MKVSLEDILNSGEFISGVSATADDVSNHRAVFTINNGAGNPIDIPIPQYAWHIHHETGERTLWVVVQAEEQAGIRAYGAIDTQTGGSMTGLETEFELIGEKAPF